MKPKNPADYQNLFRAIGQGLERLGVASFDLEIADNHDFVVSGTYREPAAAVAAKPRLKSSFLSLIIKAAKNDGNPKTRSALFHFSEIRFTLKSIEVLDRAGKASRWSHDGNPVNPHGIAHTLRMAGSFLDSKGSRFSRLSWRRHLLTLRHVNGMGVEAKEIFTPQNLYDQWVHHFRTRRPPRLLKPTGSDSKLSAK